MATKRRRITTPQSGATIYYTLDGNAPNLTSSNLVSGEIIQLTSSRKIRAIVVNGSTISRIYEADFVLNTPFDIWRQTFFGTQASGSIMSDPDRDNLVNLMEFAFGTDPTISKTGVLRYNGTFSGGGTLVECGQPITMSDGSNYHAVYIRRKDYLLSGLVYLPEFTADLSNWQVITTTPTILADNGIYQVVAIPYPVLATGKTANIFRIRITKQP
jgi:hypothetical protein